MSKDFIASAPARYLASNAATLNWMLGREALHGAYLNTKMNPLTLVDYGPETGWRGTDYIYGWIQGRGLESTVVHSEAFRHIDAGLSERLDAAGGVLAAALDDLRAGDGHAYFAYGPDMAPVRFDETGQPVPQNPAGHIYSYADTFVAKGLIAFAAKHDRTALPRHLDALGTVISAIEDRRFQLDEKIALSEQNLAAQMDDFGPWMIMLGAAGMLNRAGCAAFADAYAGRFISHVIDNHYDPTTGLLRNAPGQDIANVGHAIEFVGFALDYLPADVDPDLLSVLERILVSSFDIGFHEPAVRLAVSVETGRALSPFCPWWTLPETIRSAALLWERTGSQDAMRIWRKADDVFFDRYWRPQASIAFQCLTEDGPIDYVPATPDLDPGYHTGLSLLAAVDMAARTTTTYPE